MLFYILGDSDHSVLLLLIKDLTRVGKLICILQVLVAEFLQYTTLPVILHRQRIILLHHTE